MSFLTYMKYLNYLSLICIGFLFFGCEKEDPISISEIVGQYDGQFLTENGNSPYSATIQPGIGNTVVIDFWPSGGQFIQMQVDGGTFTISPQIFEVDNYSVAHPQCCSLLRLSANGIYKNGKIELEYLEEKRSKPEDPFKEDHLGFVYLHKRKS